MSKVYVAAGSNVEPLRHLHTALKELQRCYGPLQISPAYRNKAVGFAGDDFVNLVVGFDTTQSVVVVREQLQAIEAHCERPKISPRWAPRTMDLDILMYDQCVSDEPGLVLPRPDLLKRSYMLKPLQDIAPDLMHPLQQRTMRELWVAFAGERNELTTVALPAL